jgi:hypothetical protein
MFEQTSRLAEKLAASVSRRGFLGSLGGWAAAAAMGVAGVLTGTGTVRAAIRCDRKCCVYNSSFCYGTLNVKNCDECPPSLNGCPFQRCALNFAGGTPPRCLC